MNLPELPDPEYVKQLPLLWHYTKWFISINQVWIMIGTAIALAFAVLAMVVRLFVRDDDDDDGYDYKEY